MLEQLKRKATDDQIMRAMQNATDTLKSDFESEEWVALAVATLAMFLDAE